MNKNDNKDRIEVGLPDGSLFNYGNATIRSVCIQSSGRYNDPSANDIPDARTRTPYLFHFICSRTCASPIGIGELSSTAADAWPCADVSDGLSGYQKANAIPGRCTCCCESAPVAVSLYLYNSYLQQITNPSERSIGFMVKVRFLLHTYFLHSGAWLSVLTGLWWWV